MSHNAQETITLPARGKKRARELDRALEVVAPALVSPTGERMIISLEFYETLRKMIDLMADGKPVTVLPKNQIITTQRAAEMLGMSRPSFIKLLEEGVMPHHMVGNQRRVYLRDV